jgi:hypothetical protein
MARLIEPLREEWIPALSDFLRKGFCVPGGYCDFADPEVLRWKFFDTRGPWNVPRCLVVRENEKIVADVGICTTEFTTPGHSAASSPAAHMTDWLTTPDGASFGAALMLRAFNLAPVQYALGCTPAAARVLLRAGFTEILRAPLYHRIISRGNPAVWRAIHGHQPMLRQAAYFAADLIQSLRRAPSGGNDMVQAERVTQFGEEIQSVLETCSSAITMTSRTPALLNHYLRFPKQNISGWLLKKDGAVIGFGLLALIQKPKLRYGRIVDCFLSSQDPHLWSHSIAALESELRQMKPDLISCYASSERVRSALSENGYFRRGKTPFYLRDSKNLVCRSKPFHLSFLEADLSYI